MMSSQKKSPRAKAEAGAGADDLSFSSEPEFLKENNELEHFENYNDQFEHLETRNDQFEHHTNKI
ncbi:uncharacterized protein LY89DRAFT_415953 [Mollisia scopiformis]|uniref:Uncharacterized protein n=1 Tax=Mollisia scopiformis TaxID=149040 RepID=A0A132B1E5_MOLSC|nr:uncharacterized protein LY89DRAFT_415953 [Mollisia scopiformis]KUJ06196.1 hypothetical protein LY89DRAFT_415953 [Mollisia scopiformis]